MARSSSCLCRRLLGHSLCDKAYVFRTNLRRQSPFSQPLPSRRPLWRRDAECAEPAPSCAGHISKRGSPCSRVVPGKRLDDASCHLSDCHYLGDVVERDNIVIAHCKVPQISVDAYSARDLAAFGLMHLLGSCICFDMHSESDRSVNVKEATFNAESESTSRVWLFRGIDSNVLEPRWMTRLPASILKP
jgi:hypothetical protein